MKTLLYILFFPLIWPYLLIRKLLKIFKDEEVQEVKGRSFRIYIAGTQYTNDDGTDRQAFIKKCKAGEELILIKTPSKYDEYGIQIYRKNGECLGWIPAKYSYEFNTEMDRGIAIKAFFYRKIKPSREYNYYGARITIVKTRD